MSTHNVQVPSGQDLPNNLGATLLIAVGIVTSPAVVGLGLLFMGLADLKEANGDYCHPRLHALVRAVQNVQFWRISRV